MITMKPDAIATIEARFSLVLSHLGDALEAVALSTACSMGVRPFSSALGMNVGFAFAVLRQAMTRTAPGRPAAWQLALLSQPLSAMAARGSAPFSSQGLGFIDLDRWTLGR
jgi:hypothetical protein